MDEDAHHGVTVSPRTSRGLTSRTLVGRDAELAALVDAAGNPPVLVLVEGEAGVGKTRLVTDALGRLGNRRTLVGRCPPLREPFPFGPLVEALSQARAHAPPPGLINPITGALRDLLPEYGDRLPPALPPTTEPGVARHRLFRATVELLRALGETVLVLEDLQWAEPRFDDLLRYLAAQLPPRLSLVLTYRPEDLPPDRALRALPEHAGAEVHHERLVLAPLDRRQLRRLIGTIRGIGYVAPHVANEVHRRTGGLPYAVEELLRLLPDDAEFDGTDPAATARALDALEVPAGMRDALVARLVGLNVSARQVVAAAAVLGLPADTVVLGAVADLTTGQTTRALTVALRSSLLWPAGEGRYGFRHALAQQAVYRALAEPQRRTLHARAADILATDTPMPHAQLAHHCRQAGLIAQWYHHAEAAADEAVTVGDGEAAVELLCALLGAPGTTASDRHRLAVKLAEAATHGLSPARAVDVLRQVIAEEPMPVEVRGELRLHLGVMLCNQAGQAAAGVAEIARAETELQALPAFAARAISALSVPIGAEHSAEQHLRWMARAQELADQVDDPVLRTAITVNRATTLLAVGDPAAWDTVRQLPLDSADPAVCAQLARGAANIADACLTLGYYRRAGRFMARGLRLAEHAGVKYQSAVVASIALRLDWYAGRWAGLAERADAACRTWAGVPMLAVESELVAGLVRLARGDLPRAGRQLAGIAAMDGPEASLPVTASAAAGQARLLLSRGAADEASAQVERVLTALRRKGIWPWVYELVPVAVDVYLRSGRRDRARELVAEAAAALAHRDGPLVAPVLAGCRARLAEADQHFEQAAGDYAQAATALRAIGRPYTAAQALEARGRCVLSAGAADATDVLAALDVYQRLGATWDAGRARALLRARGAGPIHRRGRRGYGQELSPREREIAVLAARGQTNRQIAAALYLSARTVEEHISHALRKIGGTSRSDLPASLN